MTLKWMVVLTIALLVSQVSAQQPPAPQTQPDSVLKTQQDKVSYSIGANIARGFQQQGIEVNVNALMQGFKDLYSGDKPLMTDEEMGEILTAFQNELRQKQMQAAMKEAEENKKAGEAFLAENKAKEGVVTTPSGLQYKILKAGTGIKPKVTDTVEVNYRGTLVDGTEFDSSFRRGQPATFKLAEVFAGWKEALQLMPVGSKWQLFVPSQLAYGPQQRGPVIGPNSTLIFELELLAIK